MPKLTIPNTLSIRLSLYYALAFCLFLGATFTLLYWSVSTISNQRIDEDLLEDIEELSALLNNEGIGRLKKEINYETQGADKDTVFLVLYSADAEVLYRSDLSGWRGIKFDKDEVIRQSRIDTPPRLITLETDSREADTRVIYAALSPDYILVLGESLEERDDIMALLLTAFAAIFLIAIPIASVLVWFVTRRAVQGIEAVSRAAIDIKCGDLTRRVAVHNQIDEVQTLADTFDAMAERIQKLIKNMREMTDNIAHDLRSPLGRVRVLSESVLGKNTTNAEFRYAAENTINECNRLINMINISLDVAETEAGVACIPRERLDFSNIVDDACDLFEPLAEQKHLTLKYELDTDCQITGDKNSLQRMLANILDNAIKFSSAGGHIEVKLRNATNRVTLSVSDTGMGIKKQDLAHIFNRFYRCDESRSTHGCGLGLSYARAVVRAHGGEIEVNSVEGKSTTFIIKLPVSYQIATLVLHQARSDNSSYNL